MTIDLRGKTRFVDRMRVTREHLDHLQETLIQAALQLRVAIGTGKVVYGLKTSISDTNDIIVEPGYALDALARPLSLPLAHTTKFSMPDSGRVNVVISHQLRTDAVVNGRATILKDEATLSLRSGEPPYEDGGVLFARIHKDNETLRVIQKGEWYLPPLNHQHSGGFVYDSQGRWRFDGFNTGLGEPLYDSGFIPLSPGGELAFKHGLGTTRLLIQCRARSGENQITTQGLGTDYWYELPSDDRIQIFRTAASSMGPLSVQVTLWKYGEAQAGPVLPVADAGADETVELGESFSLNGSLSRAFGGRKIINYSWTQIT